MQDSPSSSPEGGGSWPQWVGTPTLRIVYPLFFVQFPQFFRNAPTITGWHPPLADKGGYPHPLRSGDPPDPHHGVLSTMTPSPHLRHMRRYPHPMSGTIPPTESPSRHPSFRVQNEEVPPLWCPEVPPHPLRSSDPLGPPKGSGSLRPTPPTYVRGWGYPLLVHGGGLPMRPPFNCGMSGNSITIPGMILTGKEGAEGNSYES